MSSSLLHILEGAFGIIESPLDPKLLCHLDVVFECVCVFECVFLLAWLGMKRSTKTSGRER